ncbi:hypothetical protein C8F01DRAFT_1265443 [Mycena amicta]|nr:hypothetical protein C8F01DRAFT_1265443 [Mycena amicta]
MHFPPPNEPTDTQGYTPKSSPLRQLTSSIPFHSAVTSHPSLRGLFSPSLSAFLCSNPPSTADPMLIEVVYRGRSHAQGPRGPFKFARWGRPLIFDGTQRAGGASAVATTPALREAYENAMKLNWLVRRWALARMFSSSSSLSLRLTGSQTLLKHPSSFPLCAFYLAI